MEFIIGLIYIGVLLYLANLQDLTKQTSPWTSMILNLMMIGLPLQMLYLGTSASLYIENGFAAFLFAVACTLLSAFGLGVVVSERLRSLIAALGMFKDRASLLRYRADSHVHTVAILLALFVIIYNMSTFALVGGSSGIAQAFDTETPPLLSALANGALDLFVALLGVGLFIRRNEAQTAARLGLRWPTRRDIVGGLVGAVILLILVYGISLFISLVVPADVLEQQYAGVEAVNTPLSASLFVALFSAVIYGTCEEILYRGAFQPIFGLIPTAMLFTLVHLQYLFTPAMLIIFGVGLGLGILRQRLSTTASIVAHIVYNALPFILVILGGSA